MPPDGIQPDDNFSVLFNPPFNSCHHFQWLLWYPGILIYLPVEAVIFFKIIILNRALRRRRILGFVTFNIPILSRSFPYRGIYLTVMVGVFLLF